MYKKIIYGLCLMPLVLTSCGNSDVKPQETSNSTQPDESRTIQPDNSGQPVADFGDFQNIAKAYNEAWDKHDVKALANFWADDGDLISPWANVFVGKKAIEQHFAEEQANQMKNATIKLKILNLRMIDQDTAFVDADFTLTGMEISGVKAAPLHDHAVFLFVKRDGNWKILIARPY